MPGDDTVTEQPEVRRPVSNAEINRELTTLKRMFSLAIQAGKLLYKPYIPLTPELRELLEAQQQRQVDDLKRTRGLIVPWVFFRLVANQRGGATFPRSIRSFTSLRA